MTTEKNINRDEFRKISNNLTALLIFRNSSRSGTACILRTEFLANRHYSEERRFYVLELAPPGMKELKMRAGERKRVEEMQKILEKTQKNFYCEGVKYPGLNETETELLFNFAQLRKELNRESKYLFGPWDQTNELSEVDQKQYTKHWARNIPKQHGMPHLIFNSTVYRKLMSSNFKDKISSNLVREAINKHTGHSAATAANYYETKTDKLRNAAVTSLYADMVLGEEENEKVAEQIDNPCSSRSIKLLAEPSEDVMEEQPNLEEDDDKDNDTDENISESEEEQESEVEIESVCSIESSRNKSTAREPIVTSNKIEKEIDDVPNQVCDVKTIQSLIKNREQRPDRQKYVLNEVHMKTLAHLYLLFIQKDRNFSAAFREKKSAS